MASDRRSTKTLAVAISVIVMVAGLWLYLSGRDKGRPVSVQADLAGRWTTENERYADRFLEISEDLIVFGQGGGSEARHRIVGVWLLPRESGVEYRIRYFADDLDQLQVVVRVSGSPPTLHLENQPDVLWVKER